MKHSAQKRTTISLTMHVADIADEMMAKRGYDNFSAYVCDLIRRDQERQQDRDAAALSRRAKRSSVR